MKPTLAIKLHQPVLKSELDGRKTVPTVGLDDRRFQYVPAIQTDLRQTFARARLQLAGQKNG